MQIKIAGISYFSLLWLITEMALAFVALQKAERHKIQNQDMDKLRNHL